MLIKLIFLFRVLQVLQLYTLHSALWAYWHWCTMNIDVLLTYILQFFKSTWAISKEYHSLLHNVLPLWKLLTQSTSPLFTRLNYVVLPLTLTVIPRDSETVLWYMTDTLRNRCQCECSVSRLLTLGQICWHYLNTSPVQYITHPTEISSLAEEEVGLTLQHHQ